MLKVAVIGAQVLLGRELTQALEAVEVSVLPLTAGPLTREQEEGDLVVFAPTPALLEGLDLVILVEGPEDALLLDRFPGRILDLREDADPRTAGDPMPLSGEWPPTVLRFRGRPALDQALALVPALVDGIGTISGTHLCGVAALGEAGLQGLLEQTEAVLGGREPETGKIGYRAAFEVVPQAARGHLLEVRVPVFHGDLLVLNLTSAGSEKLTARPAPEGVRWTEAPPSSREVAVCAEALAHLQCYGDGRSGWLTLGYDPILWGTLRPTLRLLGLGGFGSD
jgi:hypothetical protein